MTTRFFLFCFLCLPVFSAAQVVDTAMVRREVDSLVQLNRKLVGEGNFDEALRVIEVADSMALSGFGENSALYAKCLHNFGRTLFAIRKYAEAEQKYLKSLTIIEKNFSKKHVEYAKTLICMADNYQSKLDYESAKLYYLEGLAIEEEILGKEHLDYISALGNLAVLYSETGDFQKAMDLSLEVLITCEKTIGKMSQLYINTISSLANVNFYIGEYKKAEALYLEKVSLEGEFMGKKTLNYAKSLNNLAVFYDYIEEYDKAESLWLEDIAIKEAIVGSAHPDYASSLTNLAALYSTKGEYDKSEHLYNESLILKEKALGKTHPSYAVSLNNISILYKNKGQFDKAEQLCLEAILIYKKYYNTKNSDYAKFLINLAEIYNEMGDYNKSEQSYLESKIIIETLFGKQHLEYAGLIAGMGIVYFNLGNYKKSELLLLEASEIVKNIMGRDNLNYAWCLNNLASVYLLKGQLNDADSLFSESGIIFENILGKAHPDFASNLSNRASIYFAQGNYDKANLFNSLAIDIRENTLKKEHPDYASSLIIQASIDYKKDDKIRSEALLLEALAIQFNTLGKKHTSYLRTLEHLVNLYWETSRLNQTEYYLSQSSSINKLNLYKSSNFLSSQELEKHITLYQDQNESFYSFNHQTNSDSFRIASFNNALFYKGFVLETSAHLEQAIQAAPDSIRDLHSRWKGYNRLLAAELALPIAERKHVDYLDSMSNVLEKTLLRTSSAFAKAQRQIEWQDVCDALRPGEAAIEFIHYRYSDKKETDSTMYSALVTLPGAKAPLFVPLCEARQLDTLIYKPNGTRANYLQNLYASARLDGLTPMHQLIWAPIENVLGGKGIKTVYYSPTGLLHRLNLGALAEGKSGARLADRYKLVPMGSTRSLASDRSGQELITLDDAIIYGGVRYEMDSSAITNANVKMSASPQDTTGGLFGFARQTETQRDESWSYLPGTEKEAKYLNDLLRRRNISATLRLGYEATEESFKQIGQKTPSPSLLHIGTHGFFFPDPQDTSRRRASLMGNEPVFKISEYSMIRSGLKLAGSRYAWENGHPLPGGYEDGILTAYEVSQMNLSNTQLVVLSACETGLGDIRGNEGVYGLQRAFRIAGAKNVLMSLWKVPDSATEKLMTRFYTHWLSEKKPIRESFEEAQKWLRGQKGFENPYFWAGFIMI